MVTFEGCKNCRYSQSCEYNQYGINSTNCRFYEDFDDIWDSIILEDDEL